MELPVIDESATSARVDIRGFASALVWIVLCASVAGCGRGESGPLLIPVSGKVTMNGQPITDGGVCYRDESGRVQATAKIAPDGSYKLYLDRQEGAPAGKYRVVVFATESMKDAEIHNRLPRLIINKKFTDPKTTPLNVEVKKNAPPAAYDLNVSE